MKKLGMLGMLLVLLVPLAFGQVMTPKWEITKRDANLPEWFTTDHDVRGIAAADGKLYLGSFRARGIKVLDIATGALIDTVGESNVALGDVEVDEDGYLYGSSIVGHDGQWLPVAPVTVYKWDPAIGVRDTLLRFMPDTTTATGSEYFRLGDKMTVSGSYYDGTLVVYLVDSGWWGKRAFKFTMEGGEINPVPEEITFTGEAFVKTDNQAKISPLPDTDDFLFSASGQKITYVTPDGVWGDQFSTGIAGDGNAFVAFEANDRKFVVQNLIWSAQSFQVLEWTNGIPNAWRHWGMTPTAFGPSGDNANQTGDIAYINNNNGTVDVFAMMTNNGIGAYHMKVPVMPQDPVNMVSEWQIDVDVLDFFKNDNNARGMGYNPVTNHILVASRTGGAIIHILDADNGSVVGQLDMTDVTGGFNGIALMKVLVDDDGVIYACNLASGGDFKIYRWENEEAVPTVALTQAVTARFGDNLDLYGSGTDTKIYAPANNGAVIKVFGTSDGLTFAEELEIPITAGWANGGISVEDPENIWINAAWNNVRKINSAGELLAELATLDAWYGNVRIMNGPYGEKLLGMNTNHNTGNRRKVIVYDITENDANPVFWASAEAGNFENANGNVTGDLHYTINEDNTLAVFQMSSNNTIARWKLTPPIYDNDMFISFNDDSDVVNWGYHDGSNAYTTFTWDEEEAALRMNDAGWGFLGKRPVYATEGAPYRLSLIVKTTAWTHATNELVVTVEGLDSNPQAVAVNALNDYTVVVLEGTADLSGSGYVSFAGMNDGNPSEVFVKALHMDDFAADAEIAASESDLPFGPFVLNSTKTLTSKIYNNGTENLVFEQMVFQNGNYFSASVNKNVIVPGDSAVLSVRFIPELEEDVTDNLIVVTTGGVTYLTMSGSGYELWPMNWRISAGDPDTEWFWSNINQHYVRSLGYNKLNNHLYVVSRIGGPHIYILNGTTGEFIGELDNTGIAQNEATFHVNTVDVTDDGQIIVASLARTPNKFNLYHYENEMSKPTLVFSKDVGIVVGDALGVAGTGTNLKVFSAGHWSTNSNNAEIDKMLLLETTDLTEWTETIVQLPAPRDANYGISPVGDGEYLFVNGTGPSGPLYMKKDGTVLHEFESWGTSVEYFEVQTEEVKGARRFIALTSGWSSGVNVIELLGDPGDSLCTDYEYVDAPTPDYATVSNANATAMSVYNAFDNSIVELVTNNGISSYSLNMVVGNPVTQQIAVMNVDPRILDFDVVINQKTLEFTVLNSGYANLVIDSVISSSPVLSSDLAEGTIIEPGSANTYNLTVSADGLDGEFEASLVIFAENGMDKITAKGQVVSVEGNVVDENFMSWTEYGHGWSGTNVDLRTDGYGNGDANYIGNPDSGLDQPIVILTPKIMNPEKIMFYYAEYSGGSDDWSFDVVLTEDGETWTDILATYSAPGVLDWQLAVLPFEKTGEYHIGFVSSSTVAGGIFLDDVKIDGEGIAIEGTAVNEDFESWTAIPSNWVTSNVSLYNDNYSHSGTKYLGVTTLGQTHSIRTSGVVNPEHISFYYAQYSVAGDNWDLHVMLSEDGVTWSDTLAVLPNPGNLDWKYASIAVPQSGNYYIGFVVAGTISGGMFLDDLKIDGEGPYVGIADKMLPETYELGQNYPNPFNPATTIRLALPEAGMVNFTVYNILGQKVADVYQGHMEAGYHNFNFHMSNLSSGVYFYRVKVNDFTAVKKMTILK
jgi:hypothetical protein